ncbi:MAG: TIGR04282 family arsenosugar biosynthesis glycosyltransferase [Bacteroidota bacterium]
MGKNSTLLIFVKNPIPGRVKTRLAKDIGDEKAVWVYKKLLDCTLEAVAPLDVSKSVWYGDELNEDDLWNGAQKHLQHGNDLGERMSNAFDHAFQQSDKVCIIGSDCPQLSSQIINNAFHALDTHDFVLGPAVDGGYYLLGMKSFQPSVFDSIEWSGPAVYTRSIENIEKLNASYYELEKLRDVDDLDDIDALGLIIP